MGIGWDVDKGDVIRFLVDLQYTDPLLSTNYTQIARFDHNPSNPNGHDIYKEGFTLMSCRKTARTSNSILLTRTFLTILEL